MWPSAISRHCARFTHGLLSDFVTCMGIHDTEWPYGGHVLLECIMPIRYSWGCGKSTCPSGKSSMLSF